MSLPGNNPARRGFTLLELMVVLVLLGLAASLVGPRFDGLLNFVRGADRVQMLADTLRAARNDAVRLGLPHTVEVDYLNAQLRTVAGGRTENLAWGDANTLLQPGLPDPALKTVRFLPSGSAQRSVHLPVGGEGDQTVHVVGPTGRVWVE